MGPLSLACQGGHWGLCALLLAAGADREGVEGLEELERAHGVVEVGEVEGMVWMGGADDLGMGSPSWFSNPSFSYTSSRSFSTTSINPPPDPTNPTDPTPIDPCPSTPPPPSPTM
ncbi:hypothetical protein B484DRAFT_458097 [Ochromonadaceae sp. CCMP2298]|nr:hypothetical protein B484DRAFT_458097 [Ochromonadaceae sp. CCMP2298]